MPEGLSPIEAGKQLHEHNQAPPEPAPPTGSDRHARIVQIGEALLLSLVTIAAAWSGMPRPSGAPSPASSWPGPPRCATWLPGRPGRPVHPQLRLVHVQRLVHRLHPGRSPEAGDRRAALPARVPVAFDAWMATDPLHNPRAAPGPTYMPEYKLADQAKADALDREAEAASAAGDHAAVVGDEYIRITVFLAAVLFLVGIGSTFKLPNVCYALIAVGAVLLILASALIVRQPGIPA